MTEKIEKDLESKRCPKHHGSTAEPDKPIPQVQAAWKDDPSVCVWCSGCMGVFWPQVHSETTASWKTGQPWKEDLTSVRTLAFSRTMKSNLTVSMLVPKYFKMWNAYEPNDKNVFFKKTKTWAGFLSSTTLAASLSVHSVNYSFWSSFLMTSRWPESQSCLCEKFSGKLGVSRCGVCRVWGSKRLSSPTL